MTSNASLELPAPGSEPISVKLTCNKCAAAAELAVPWLVADSHAEGWDGVVLGRLFECECGAVDDYKLDAGTHLWLTRVAVRNVFARRDGRPPFDERITVGKAVIHAGTGQQIYRRPSEAIRLLREEVDQAPSAENWRRLGNFLGKHVRDDEARDAWRRASSADTAEALAPVSLADSHFRGGETVEGFRWMCQGAGAIAGREADRGGAL